MKTQPPSSDEDGATDKFLSARIYSFVKKKGEDLRIFSSPCSSRYRREDSAALVRAARDGFSLSSRGPLRTPPEPPPFSNSRD